jgi:hypothetical protein
MKASTRHKIMGNRLYSIYRRCRYLRYLKKLKKHKRRHARIEKKLEEKQFRDSLRNLSASSRLPEKQKLTSRRQEEREERARIKRELRSRLKVERQLEKNKARTEKEEKKRSQREVRRILKEKALQEQLIEKQRREELKEEKRLFRRRKKELRPYLIRRRTRELLYEIRSMNLQSIGRFFTGMGTILFDSKARGNFVKIFLNSVLLFIISYELIYLIGQLITVWVATTFDYRVILFPYKIFYNIDSDQWSADSVKILYSIVPLTGLILGIVCIIIFSNIRNHPVVFKLFYLWGFVHGMVLFFGSTLMGALLNQGFGWVLAYMYYRDTGKMIFSIIAIFALVSIGGGIARSFLISGNSYLNNVNRENRRFLFFGQVLFPGIIGTIVIALLKIPPDPYFMGMDEYLFEVSKIGTFMLLLIPMALTFKSFGETFFDEAPRMIRFKWIYLFFAIILIVSQIFFLGSGLSIDLPE